MIVRVLVAAALVCAAAAPAAQPDPARAEPAGLRSTVERHWLAYAAAHHAASDASACRTVPAGEPPQ